MSAPVNQHPNQFGVPLKTTDATQTTTATFPTKTDRAYHVTAKVLGMKDDSANIGVYTMVAAFKNDGGTLSLVGSIAAVATIESDSNWAATLDASDTDIRVRVTGVAATNISWLTQLEVVEVGNYYANYGMAEPS